MPLLMGQTSQYREDRMIVGSSLRSDVLEGSLGGVLRFSEVVLGVFLEKKTLYVVFKIVLGWFQCLFQILLRIIPVSASCMEFPGAVLMLNRMLDVVLRRFPIL